MGNPKAFLTIPRKEAGYRPIHDRILDFSEVEQTLNSNDRRQQASRCMDCGVPFCHWACPLGNKAPEWNDALYKGDWEQAYRLLNSTNDFPEFTGRICPALCEKACVLNLMDHEPTTNREDECAIVEHAFSEDYVHVEIPERNGKTVAVIGAGPAGLVAANQLNHKGYKVTVFEAVVCCVMVFLTSNSTRASSTAVFVFSKKRASSSDTISRLMLPSCQKASMPMWYLRVLLLPAT